MRTRVLRIMALAAALLVAVALGWWAASAALRPPSPDTVEPAATTYRVVEGEVERSLTYTARGEWPERATVRNGASGTITSVMLKAGAALRAGTTVYAVNERPVVVAEGDIPAYRDLALGNRGGDVRQLQRFLISQGHEVSDPAGLFGSSTAWAVRAWQTSIGHGIDGIVRLGDVVFLPDLPARVIPTEALATGRAVSPGDEVLTLLAPEPNFSITLAEEQADLVPLKADVVIDHEGGSWQARIDSATPTSEGEMRLDLVGRGGAAPCAARCAREVPADTGEFFRAHVVVVPRTTGPVVPAAALRVLPDGKIQAFPVDGEPVTVTVKASDGGQFVVDGLEVGTEVQLFGSA